MDTVKKVVSLSDIEFSWAEQETPTLKFDLLEINQNEHVFIKGPSGSGKSTLLGLLTGIMSPQQGKVQILATDISQLKQNQRDKFRADHIGYIFQQFNLLPYLSVIDNVILPCHFSKIRKKNVAGDLKAKAIHLLDRLHLDTNLLHKPIIELSIGQQQRVAAARALIGQPELLIADEPTSALDFDNRSAFIELLMEEAKQANSTLIFVSHDPTLESLFDTSIHLNQLNKQAQMIAKEAK
ncbi:ABC transporter ATP-binding protein [Vibrio sp. TH_r3]|uniref:ABC transporter ATP-binding protein n=1 Tax=Vibrio sp. TH_r3 TaxID=3082084 RepID=UPI002953A8F3|nr:ABC transporter ATP-binding protein [Vibrio sp. TH_r3]MDV7105646.1 ABC transporter ATP-binding protein [Vibrio sp. TH_r3]